jgi:uncharacterized protein
MLHKTLVVMLSLVFVPSAQTATKSESLKEIVELMHIKETLAENAKQALVAQLGQAQNFLPKSIMGMVDSVAGILIQATKEDTVFQKKMMSIYNEYFTDQELKDFIIFLKSPTGQKLVQHQFEILMKANEIAQEWLKKIQPKMTELIMKKLFENNKIK